MGQSKNASKDTNASKGILAAVVIALLTGGSAPWWVGKFFPKSDPVVPPPPPVPTPQAVLPDVRPPTTIWDAVQNLRASGFNQLTVELKHDATAYSQGRVAPGGTVTRVADAGGAALEAGRRYPTDTGVHLTVQNDPAWNTPASISSDPQDVDKVVEFCRTKQLEAEKKGVDRFKQRDANTGGSRFK